MKDRNTATTVIPVIIRSLKKGPFLKIEYLISTIDITKKNRPHQILRSFHTALVPWKEDLSPEAQ